MQTLKFCICRDSQAQNSFDSPKTDALFLKADHSDEDLNGTNIEAPDERETIRHELCFTKVVEPPTSIRHESALQLTWATAVSSELSNVTIEKKITTKKDFKESTLYAWLKDQQFLCSSA